jgi:hypothetical protein
MFEVRDDAWAPPEGLQDALDFHLARHAPAQIWEAEPAEMFVKRESWGLVLSGDQFQVPLGTDEQPGNMIARNFPDPWDINRTEDTFEEAAQKYGIVVDLVQIASDRKAVEMLIPWDYVGAGGPMGEPPTGARLGLALGYNDHDPGRHSEGTFDRLRWSNRLDPWWHAGDKGPDPDPWGTLEMGPMLSS